MNPLPQNPARTIAQTLARQLRSQGVFCAAEETARRKASAVPESGLGWLLGQMPEDEGGLSEWIPAREGAATVALLIALLKEQKATEEPVLVVEGDSPVNPPAWEALGLGERTVFVRTASLQDRLWALEQALRCRGVRGVIAWVDRLPDRSLRRLQLAAEQGRGWAFLIRPPEAQREKCWGDVRFLVEPRASSKDDILENRRSVTIEVLARRGGVAARGQTATAEICHATGYVRLVPFLADSTPARRAVRA